MCTMYVHNDMYVCVCVCVCVCVYICVYSTYIYNVCVRVLLAAGYMVVIAGTYVSAPMGAVMGQVSAGHAAA